MNKFYSLLIFVLTNSVVLAQPVLNSNNFTFLEGDSYVLFDHDATGFNAGSAGADVTWDFSSFASGTPIKCEYGPVEMTFFQNASSYPTANLALKLGNDFFLYHVENGVTTVIGSADSITTFGAVKVYSGSSYGAKSPILYSLPMTFGYDETYDVEYNYQELAPGSQSPIGHSVQGTYNVKADAYGTLDIDGGSINNVLRLRIEEATEQRDGNGNLIVYFNILTYEYIEPTTRFPIVRYQRVNKDGSFLKDKLTIMSYNNTGVGNFENASEISIYPNPAKEFAIISTGFDQLQSIRVFDINGRLVDANLNAQPFGNQIQISLNNFSYGMYIVEVLTANGLSTHKLVKQ